MVLLEKYLSKIKVKSKVYKILKCVTNIGCYDDYYFKLVSCDTLRNEPKLYILKIKECI